MFSKHNSEVQSGKQGVLQEPDISIKVVKKYLLYQAIYEQASTKLRLLQLQEVPDSSIHLLRSGTSLVMRMIKNNDD